MLNKQVLVIFRLVISVQYEASISSGCYDLVQGCLQNGSGMLYLCNLLYSIRIQPVLLSFCPLQVLVPFPLNQCQPGLQSSVTLVPTSYHLCLDSSPHHPGTNRNTNIKEMHFLVLQGLYFFVVVVILSLD